MVHILGQDTFEEKIKAFQLRREKIVALEKQVDADKKALDAWVATTEICKKWQTKLEELNKEMETYKADQKATFGLCDGERTDILALVQAIKKVGKLD